MLTETQILLFFTLLWSLLPSVRCGVEVQIRMMTFRDDNERDYEGLCCDWSCTGQCDPVFTFCIDKYQGTRSFHSCPILRKTTNVYQSKNVVNFGPDMMGVNNPITVVIPVWGDGIMLKVKAEDDDTGHSGNDRLDEFYLDYNEEPYPGSAKALWKQMTLKGQRTLTTPTTLVLRIRAYCEPYYFGTNCSTYCKPQNSPTGHYWCDPTNAGQMVCQPGWTNTTSNCTDPCTDPDQCQVANVDNKCSPDPCKNDAMCRLKSNWYECLCLPGFTNATCGDLVEPEPQKFEDINTEDLDIPYTPEGLPMWIVAMIIVLMAAAIIFSVVFVIVKKQNKKEKQRQGSENPNPVYEDSTSY